MHAWTHWNIGVAIFYLKITSLSKGRLVIMHPRDPLTVLLVEQTNFEASFVIEIIYVTEVGKVTMKV